MKTVTVRYSAGEMKRLLELAKEEDLVVRSPEGDEFVLSLVDDFEVEIALQRRNKKLMAFLKRRFREARKEKGTPLEEVRRQLGLDSNGAKGSRRKTGPH